MILNFKDANKLLINHYKKIFYELSNDFIKSFKYYNKNLFNASFYNIPSAFQKKNKSIVLYFEDNHNYTMTSILSLLEKNNYIVKVSPDNPDYLIYNVFGCEHLKDKYKNSIKIAILTENQIPDFYIADYAISHSHIHFLDRHFKYPYYFLEYLKIYNYFDIHKKNNNNVRNKFCAALISHTHITGYFRLNFIDELNKYKRVDMGGKYKNNVGKVINKIEFLSSYKFSIAMENTEADGYASEKIIQSFMSGTIPIYYGDYMIDEYINPKAFILIRGEKDMMKKIDYIKKIDNNDKLYRSILKEKIFISNDIPKNALKEYNEFLLHIFKQDKNNAKRIDNINKYF